MAREFVFLSLLILAWCHGRQKPVAIFFKELKSIARFFWEEKGLSLTLKRHGWNHVIDDNREISLFLGQESHQRPCSSNASPGLRATPRYIEGEFPRSPIYDCYVDSLLNREHCSPSLTAALCFLRRFALPGGVDDEFLFVSPSARARKPCCPSTWLSRLKDFFLYWDTKINKSSNHFI